MRNILLSVLMLAALVSGAAQENLLPAVCDDEAIWEVGRNAEANAVFEVTEDEGEPAFHVNIKSETGYTLYRCYPELKPGRYTFMCFAKGESAAGLYAEAYAFDAQGEPKMIMNYKTAAGTIAERTLMYDHLVVPPGTVNIRLGVGVSGQGEGYFTKPQLFAGDVPKPADLVEEVLPAIQTGWIAKWIYLADDPGVPRVDFTKKLVLGADAVSAKVQLTADNGYEILVNGEFVGGDVNWQDVEVYDLKNVLKEGENTVEVHVLNYDGIGGLLLQGQVIDGKGVSHDLVSDESWEISLPSGEPAKITVHGKVPMSPWGAVPFHRIVPPKTYALPVVEAVTDIEAGEILHYVFELTEKLAAKKELKLDIRFTDADGRLTPLSAFPLTMRFVPEQGRLYADLATSRYAMPGEYQCEITGQGFVIPGGRVVIRPVELEKTAGAPLPKPSQSNVMETMNFRQSLFTHSMYAAPDEVHFRSWTGTGGHLYEVNFYAGYWNSRNRFDSSEVEAVMMRMLENDPYASIVMKFRLDVPGWWTNAHPDDLFRSSAGRAALQSFCSDAWRRDGIDAVCATLDELAARPVGQAIVGVLLMAYRGGEFQLWGEDVGEYDCSPIAQAAFQKYLADHGVAREITLPHPALQFPLGETDAEGAEVRDLFFRFVAERQADNLAFFTREFHKRYGDRYIIGMYYGYGMEYAGSHSRMLLAGHLGLEKLLADQAPDLLSCPLSYGLRRFDRSHAFMYPVDSARIHGILPIGENDVRNYLTPEVADSSGSTILSLTDTVADNRRIRVFEAAHGALVRYLALHPTVDWYFDQPLVRSIRADNELVQGLVANPPDGGDDAQVVLVANLLEWTRGWRVPEETFGTFAGYSRDTLMHTGRPVSYLTFDDYAARVDRWRNAMIPIPGLLTDAQRATLEAAYGALPPIKIDDGALLLVDGKWKVLPGSADAKAIWKAFATEEAREAGFGTIWYVGQNFKYSWDGKTLTKY